MEPVLASVSHFSNDPSSQTADSASLQPTRPSAVRIEDTRKFVVRRDVQAKSHADLQATMAKVELALKLVATDLEAIQNAIQWRALNGDAFEGFREVLVKAKATLGTQGNRLHGTRGVDKHIPAVVESGSIPEIIQRVQALELEFFCLQKKQAKLEALSDAKHFQDRLIQSKNQLPLLALQPDDVASVNTFSRLVDECLKGCLESIDDELYQLYEKGTQEGCDLCISRLKKYEIDKSKNKPEQVKLCATKELQLETLMLARCMIEMQQEAIKERMSLKSRVCKALISYFERDLQRKRFQIEPFGRKTVAADFGGWLQPGDETLINGKDVDAHELQKLPEGSGHEYKFWMHAPGKNWYSLGWYAETGALGLQMEADVGLCVHGLLLKLKRLIIDVSQGSSRSKVEFESDLRHYDGSVVALEKELDAYIEKVCKAPRDALTQPLLDYAYGLNWGLREARCLVKLASKCMKAPAQAVFGAISGIQKHYSALQGSSAVGRMVRFYYSVEEMEEAEQKVPALKDTEFNTFLKRAAEYMHELHANKDPELLELSAEEALVPSLVLTEVSMSELYTDGESQEGLAQMVLLYMVKRIMQFVFLPSLSHDMELELVLHTVRKNYEEKYYQSLFDYDGLGRIFGRYDDLCKHKRFDVETGLVPALEIARLAFDAQKVHYDVLAYVEAWQRLFEYARSTQTEGHVCMYNVLAGWLHNASVKHDYDKICPVVATTDIEAWGSNDPESFLPKLENHPQAKQEVFSAIVLRVVGAALYAQDTIEQVAAQGWLAAMLDCPEYTGFIDALSNDIKLLIAENAIKKINTTSQRQEKTLRLVFKEEQFLLDGPFTEFFAAAFLSVDQAAIQMALYRLIQSQGANGLLAAKCKEKWGSQYERWLEGYDALVKGNPLVQWLNQ